MNNKVFVIKADGVKSDEWVRLVLAFLAGMAVTILLMQVTAGNFLQEYFYPDDTYITNY